MPNQCYPPDKHAMIYGNRSFIVVTLIHADRVDLADKIRSGKLSPGQAARLAGLRPRRKLTPPPSRPRFVLALMRRRKGTTSPWPSPSTLLPGRSGTGGNQYFVQMDI